VDHRRPAPDRGAIATDFAIGHATASLDSYTPGEAPAAPAIEAAVDTRRKAPASTP
jgi:hypothetical protein